MYRIETAEIPNGYDRNMNNATKPIRNLSSNSHPSIPLEKQLSPLEKQLLFLTGSTARRYLSNLVGWWLVFCLLGSLALAAQTQAIPPKMRSVRVCDDQRGFIFEKDRSRFVPWGFNYDHDEGGRLLEDYWETEWPKIEDDFKEMKELGANVVRIHLQLGRFMQRPDEPNVTALDKLTRLVELAEKLQLYLDITGLGCYHKKDVPLWYDGLSEKARWDVQARFWEAVAARCANSPAIFCYDLMNEPVVPGGKREPGDWLGPAFAGKHFVQFVTLDQAGRPRPTIARQWIKHLTAAIRKHDRRHLITVGLVSWSLDRPGLTSGFVPENIIADVNFLSVHLYPDKSGLDKAIDTLRGFSVGKPVVIEEIFPLNCSVTELEEFMDKSQTIASGWMGFYWGKTPQQCRRSKEIVDALMLGWLDLFEKKADAIKQHRGLGVGDKP